MKNRYSFNFIFSLFLFLALVAENAKAEKTVISAGKRAERIQAPYLIYQSPEKDPGKRNETLPAKPSPPDKSHGNKSLKSKIVKKKLSETEQMPTERTLFLTILLVLIAIVLPPLAVLLVDGLRPPFWLSILLTLLFYVPGLIYALIRIFRT